MKEELEREALLLGQEALEQLKNKRVAVFGVGGVGGYVVEALARGGIGALDLIDNDIVARSNINRQIIATQNTVGMVKVEAAKERVLSINPDIKVTTYQTFYLPENKDDFPFEDFDYVVDAIDTVTGKISLVMQAKEYNVPIISAMGAGNKLDPTAFEVTDIYKTSVCPLAKVMRRELKKRGIKKLKVVYSKEEAMKPIIPEEENKVEKNEATQTPEVQNMPDQHTIDQNTTNQQYGRKRQTPGSISFVPSVCGLIMAGEVIKDLCRG